MIEILENAGLKNTGLNEEIIRKIKDKVVSLDCKEVCFSSVYVNCDGYDLMACFIVKDESSQQGISKNELRLTYGIEGFNIKKPIEITAYVNDILKEKKDWEKRIAHKEELINRHKTVDYEDGRGNGTFFNCIVLEPTKDVKDQFHEDLFIAAGVVNMDIWLIDINKKTKIRDKCDQVDFKDLNSTDIVCMDMFYDGSIFIKFKTMKKGWCGSKLHIVK